MGWKPFEGTVTGNVMYGDPKAPVSRWWNNWWLIAFGWKKVAVFEAKLPNPVDPFFVGFRASDGTMKLNDEPQHARMFRVLIGRESCTFFAVGTEGEEIPLVHLRTVTRDDPAYRGAPLI
jgi:hypothetical protein